mgnify:FL=1
MIRWLHSHPLTGFVVLAYAGSWVFWVPFIPLQRLIPTQSYNYAAAGAGQLALLAGPFLASLIMTRLTTGSLRAWVSPFKRWRVPPASYALALIAIPVVIMTASAVLPGKEAGTPSFVGPAVVIGPLIQAVAFLIGGPIQEEVGWRGFALPILQERFRPLQAAVVIGLIWGGWHLPQFFVSAWETPHNNASDVLGFFALTVTSSIVISWITNLARGSVLLAILAHNSINWAPTTWSGITGQQATTIWPATAGMAVLAVVALIATRGRLGFGAPAESALAEPANG